MKKVPLQTTDNHRQFTLVKLPIQEIIAREYRVTLSSEEEIPFLVSQGNSLLLDQIARLRGQESSHVAELILVSAKKSPRTVSPLERILTEGFFYNGILYKRFGKSASQAKDGITAFLSETVFAELYRATQLDLEIKECVISKYEAQRCLVFSSCTLIPDYMPRIVIIGEYQKILKDQYIRYAAQTSKTITDPETGASKQIPVKEIREGRRDLGISPFDGCGCHELAFSQKVQQALGLDYLPVGAQIRLPFLKGFSVYVPFREMFHEMGVTHITDVYGQRHAIEEIDCIWNISMFKCHHLFLERYQEHAWEQYVNVLQKYRFKLGISKYSHHKKDFPLKSRMNFQYLQCLDLWNEHYRKHFRDKTPYSILSTETEGKIIQLARYTTDFLEKIIKGDLFYTCMFLGMTGNYSKNHSQYTEALQINPRMLQDPAVQNFLYRKLKKQITEAKLGKIYADGFYHTIVGDMVGYLEYAAGKTPAGCLKAGEFYAPTLPEGQVLSFRSPLVDPSEVNQISLTSNLLTCQWFSHFQDQDVAMINMYDLSLPQQGGADCDGDAVFLCHDPLLLHSRISKPIIVDVEDKNTAEKKPYTLPNITAYEIASRDSRIGEITNCATSIENKDPDTPELEKRYSDMTSLLRIIQGKEIDSLKTGTRWHMDAGMRKHLKQLPWFLLWHYPKKRKTFQDLQRKNKDRDLADRLPLPAFFSPSPMNELCSYINAWEQQHLIWNRPSADNRDILLNHDFPLDDRQILRQVRHMVNDFSSQLRLLLARSQEETTEPDFEEIRLLTDTWKQKLFQKISVSTEEELANYVIKVCYSNPSLSKQPAWAGYSQYILKNLRENSPEQARFFIQEIPQSLAATEKDCQEYLGKYYKFSIHFSDRSNS
ncbi:MAG: hypothetical protein HFH41_12920 [Lachnospiraceae bacterium]|nr:hypothetical protein [Lachnospiraceae bacterium]